MGSKASILLQDQEIQEIKRETGFSHNQIVRLFSRFQSLDKSLNGYLTREDFLRIPELAINPLGDRIAHAFFNDGSAEEVNFRQFIRVLARFRPVNSKRYSHLNTREEKLKFAFRMYDVNCDGSINKDELLAVLHMMVGANISEDQLNSIAERTLREADKDYTGELSFIEFRDTMSHVKDIDTKMSIRNFE